MKKQLAALVLTLTLAAGLSVPAAAVFQDVAEGKYYTDAVAWAVEQGITAGTTETTFSPDAPCTRGQILTFLWRSAGEPEPNEDTANPFSDVAEGAYYYNSVLWALEQKILEERETLGPDTPCTRGETMLYLWRHAGSPKPETTAVFDDVSLMADYAQAMSWAVETGITAGTTENTFSPNSPCTRSQIVTFLYRSLNREDPLSTTLSPVEIRPFQTLTGTGAAYSLGLDGSEFSSGTAYEAQFRVDIYSPTEAAFTIAVPFPLFQAWDYAIRFAEEDSGVSYVFSHLRWDEAFGDMVDWPVDHDYYRLAEMTNRSQTLTLEPLEAEDDRMGGSVTWRIVLPEESTFRFDRTDRYQVSCEVSANPLPWAQTELPDSTPPQSEAIQTGAEKEAQEVPGEQDRPQTE